MDKQALTFLEDKITEYDLMDNLIETAKNANVGEATVYRALDSGPTTKKRRLALRKAKELVDQYEQGQLTHT